MKTKTKELIEALHTLDRNMRLEYKVSSVTIIEAANRLGELQAEVERLRVEVASLKPYRDNHHDFMQHIVEHDAAVIERAENNVLSNIFYAPSSPVTPSKASEIMDWWPKFKACKQAKEANQ